MKGIILAGGSGSRLSPITNVINKHLLPIYNKPMIYYPLETLISSGVSNILIISTPKDISLYSSLLGTGDEWGAEISYAIQPSPDGIAEALIIGEDFVENDPVVLALGDNIFSGERVSNIISEAIKNVGLGAVVFGVPVDDPSRFGVAEIDEFGDLTSIVEKPTHPSTNLAIPGLYVYGPGVSERAKKLSPSERGELEITDLNLKYLKEGELQFRLLGDDCYWLDTGTHDSLFEASLHFRNLSNK